MTTVGSNGGPSAYGAFDMGGNVQEWNDAGGTASANEMIRGGAWNELIATNLSSSINSTIVASAGDGSVGFRLASPAVVPRTLHLRDGPRGDSLRWPPDVAEASISRAPMPWMALSADNSYGFHLILARREASRWQPNL